MALLKPHPINSTRFLWLPQERTFVADSSDFGPLREARWPWAGIDLGQVYDDAADAGFTLISDRTGKEVVFAFAREERREDEIIAWEFEPVPESLRTSPECEGVRVIICND